MMLICELDNFHNLLTHFVLLEKKLKRYPLKAVTVVATVVVVVVAALVVVVVAAATVVEVEAPATVVVGFAVVVVVVVPTGNRAAPVALRKKRVVHVSHGRRN
jgi:hypothetical protein